jgi:protocatechuate 3,4-dioxygenase beta subunit
MDDCDQLSDRSWADMHRSQTGRREIEYYRHTVLNISKEFILLSDIVGLSLLIDSINHPKPKNGTEGTVLGPFHTHDAEPHPNGETISHDPQGEPCLVLCTVKDTEDKPIEGVKIDIWETDSTGRYDVQYADRAQPDGRAVMKSDAHGVFWFRAIVPVPYPIPHDVGHLAGLSIQRSTSNVLRCSVWENFGNCADLIIRGRSANC